MGASSRLQPKVAENWWTATAVAYKMTLEKTNSKGEIKMTLGEQIRKGRESAKLSQEELAERIGVSRQAVSKWESDLSVPTGANRRALSEILTLDMPVEEEPPKRKHALCFAGWILAVAAMIALVFSWVHIGRNTGTASQDPSIYSVQFYNADQEEVLASGLWYNTAQIESILIQWNGEYPPYSVKLFFTPSGTETTEETELLEVAVPTGGHALLLSADSLHRGNFMGRFYVELSFGSDRIISSDLYNVFFDPKIGEPVT